MNAEAFLTNIVCALAASPDFRATIDNLASLATKQLCDWCSVYMFENEQTIRRLAVSPTAQVEALFPLDLHATTGPAHVRRTGVAELRTEVDEEIAAGLGLKPEEVILGDGGKPCIYACIPAMARNRMIGAVVFICGNEKRFGEAEVSLAKNLADAAAVAMDNSKLYREAQEANRLKDEFVAMVSHELRTPLTPILGCIHLLRTTKLNQPNFDRALEMIERNAHTQLQIVEDLLDASRIVAGKLHIVKKSTTVMPIVEAAIDTVKSSAEAKGIKIITRFGEVDEPIDGDPHRLQQIIWNLLSNAVKFTPADGRIEISIQSNPDHVQIQVTDTGVGIPADLMPYIFDRFRQGTDSNSKMRSGLGLGLAIVRHLVELHNGSIEAASAGPGQGAVFTLTFPTAARRAAGAAAGSDG
jgi:signal transduction histidine kinase